MFGLLERGGGFSLCMVKGNVFKLFQPTSPPLIIIHHSLIFSLEFSMIISKTYMTLPK